MKLIIQKADNFKEVNKIIEIESTEIDNNDISYFIKTNETPIVKYTDTDETFLINNIQEFLKQYEGSEILLTIGENDLISLSKGGAIPDLTGYATEEWVLENTPQGLFLGSITPTDTPTGTAEAFWNATEPGTYTNFGNVVVNANSFAFISRNASGVFSISQSEIDLSNTEIYEEYQTNNLIDENNLGYGYLNGLGIPVYHASIRLSDYLPINQGDVINSFFNGNGLENTSAFSSALYDENKNFLTKFSISQNYTVVNTSAKYMRIVFFNSNSIYNTFSDKWHRVMFKNAEIPNYYENAIEYQLKNTLSAKTIEKEIFTITPLNLLLLNNYILKAGTIDQNTGNEADGSGVAFSWWLPIEPLKMYVTNGYLNQWGAVYDENKNYIKGVSFLKTSGNQVFIDEPNAKFIRLSFSNTLITNKTAFFGLGLALPTDLTTTENIVEHKNSISKIEELEKFANPLKALKWCALGDSITQGIATTPTNTYTYLIGQKYGILAKNYGLAGSRITYDSLIGGGTEMVTRYLTMDDDADIITVFGGINDINNSLPIGVMGDTINSTMYGAMDILAKGLHIKYPGKRIGFILPINYGGTSYLPYLNAMKEVLNKYSIPFLDMHKEGNINTVVDEIKTTFVPDGLHPNSLGHVILARKIYHFLLTL